MDHGTCYGWSMSDTSQRWSRPALVSLVYLALASVGVAWVHVWGDGEVWRWSEGRVPEFWKGIVGGIVIGGGFVVGSRFVTHRYEWGRLLHQDLRARLGPLSSMEILILAAASSLGEEIFFRGALLPAVGLWLSSLIFALLHIGPKLRFLPWTLASFLAGLAFGLLFAWSGDLTGPVIAHFTVNTLNLRYLSITDLR
jgi:membrane protease YdiL (CAAX protease family)